MKKIILFFILILLSKMAISAQTYTTGTVTLTSDFDVKINITATQVKLTLKGPNDRWFGIGFGGNSMGSTTDAFISESTGQFDRRITSQSTPSIDGTQDWTIILDNVVGSQRVLIATRSLSTSETHDYTFTHSNASIPLIWAHGPSSSTMLAYHGSNKSSTTLTLTSTATIDELNNILFSLYPNPANTVLNLVLPSNINNADVTIYDVLSKKVFTQKIQSGFNTLDISKLTSGLYVVKITSKKNIFTTKRFVKE